MEKQRSIAEQIWSAFADADIKIGNIMTSIPEQNPISNGLGRLSASDMANQIALDYWLEDRLRTIESVFRNCELTDLERLRHVVQAVEDYFEQKRDIEEDEDE